MNVTRRLFLRYGAAVSAAAAPLGAAVAEAEPIAPPVPSAEERFQHHLDGLKTAAMEIDPRIGSWHVSRSADDDLGCSVIISAFRVSGRYEGDGVYVSGLSGVTGSRTRYSVRLRPDLMDGHRTFDVVSTMDRMILPEPRFNTFIGRKVS